LNQEITINKSIINYFNNSLPVYGEVVPAQKIWQYLKENKLIIDKERKLLNELWEQIEQKIEDYKLKNSLKEYIDYFSKGRLVIVELENFKDEVELCKKSNDRIFLDPVLSKKEINKKHKKFNDIEFHNEKSFISPKVYQRIKHSEMTLLFDKDENYEIEKIFEPYLRNTEFLKIIDPFLPNKGALNNLKKILDCYTGERILLKYYEKNLFKKYKRNEKKAEKEFIEFENYINKNHKFKIQLDNFKKKQHHDRYIITDKVEIKLPGGLDFLVDGKIRSEDEEDKVQIIVKPVPVK